MKQVVISVIGGVAYIEHASPDVEVSIIDFDNFEEKGKSGSHALTLSIARAKKDEKKPI